MGVEDDVLVVDVDDVLEVEDFEDEELPELDPPDFEDEDEPLLLPEEVFPTVSSAKEGSPLGPRDITPPFSDMR